MPKATWFVALLFFGVGFLTSHWMQKPVVEIREVEIHQESKSKLQRTVNVEQVC
jgi:hypothetical protein